MRRSLIVLSALLIFAAACGDSGDSGNGTEATVVSNTGGGGGTTITLPVDGGSDITVIVGSSGTAEITIGGSSYSVPLDQCAVTSESLLVSGETDEIAFGLVTGVGLAMTLNPDDAEDRVAYVVGAPDVVVSGTSVTGGGEAQGVTAAGFGDSEPWTIAVNC